MMTINIACHFLESQVGSTCGHKVRQLAQTFLARLDNLLYQGDCSLLLFSLIMHMDRSLACVIIDLACYFKPHSFVITHKLCGLVKTNCYIFFLRGCSNMKMNNDFVFVLITVY